MSNVYEKVFLLTVLSVLFATLSAYSNNSEPQRKYSTYYYRNHSIFRLDISC